MKNRRAESLRKKRDYVLGSLHTAHRIAKQIRNHLSEGFLATGPAHSQVDALFAGMIREMTTCEANIRRLIPNRGDGRIKI